jgi:hypothetical protein
VGERGGRFEFSSEPTGLAIDPHLTRAHELDFGGIISDSRLTLSLEYNPARLPASTAIALLADFKHHLVALIEHCRYATNPVLRRFDSSAVEDVYPLSPMQEGLLFQSLVDPDTEVYCIQAIHRIRGLLRADVFQHCWNILTRRHAVLRSVFLHEGLERPLQVVLKERSPEFHFFDIRGLTVEEQLRRLDQFRREERERGFNLQQDVLMHVTLFQREDEVHELIWSYHHILLDGWCLGVIYRELIQSYRALCQGQEPHLPPVAPFRRYIDWLRRFDREKARNYWAHYTAGYDRTATFPKSQTEGVHHEICETDLVLEATVTAGLKRLAVRHRVTLNTVVQCLWGLLLCRHNDIDDVIFGAVVSGRPSDLDGVEDMVGVFINTLPVRIRYDGGQTFAELLKASQQAALESQPHDHLSLAEIQALSPLGRNLFDHLLDDCRGTTAGAGRVERDRSRLSAGALPSSLDRGSGRACSGRNRGVAGRQRRAADLSRVERAS